jgi:hypothetical protein
MPVSQSSLSIRQREITTEIRCLQSTALAGRIHVHAFILIECKSRRVYRQVAINPKYRQSKLDDYTEMFDSIDTSWDMGEKAPETIPKLWAQKNERQF